MPALMRYRIIFGVLAVLVFALSFAVQRVVVAPRVKTVEVARPDARGVPGEAQTPSPFLQIILPHHLVAIEQMRALLANVRTQIAPQRIVVVSPNHFGAGHGAVQVFAVPYAVLDETHFPMDAAAIDALPWGIARATRPFTREHGIFNLLPLLHTTFPDARFVPVMVRPGAAADDVAPLVAALSSQRDVPTLVVYSVDFVHNGDIGTADIKNRVMAQRLAQDRVDDVDRWDVDCPACLRVATAVARANGTHFALFAHSSAAAILRQPLPGENTSYILGTFSEQQSPPDGDTAAALFVGDIMLDRSMRALADAHGGVGALIAPVERLFCGADVVVGNLEGVVSDAPSVSVAAAHNTAARDHYRFRFPAARVRAVADAMRAPLVVFDGNNHILDFGADAVTRSRAALAAVGIPVFGDVRTQDVATQVLRRTLGGRAVSFVSFNAFLGHGFESAHDAIAREAAAGRDVVVLTHWGTEYVRTADATLRAWAHGFIDAGARLVVGTHPHVLQPLEVYKGGVIFYSLGNFLFDQFFSADVRERPVALCAWSDTQMRCALTPLAHKYKSPLAVQNAADRAATWNYLADTALGVTPAQRETLRTRGTVVVE